MTNETNGISLRRLKTFLTNLKNIFAEKKHSHATSDITGLDTALSSKATLAQGDKADSAVQSVKIGTKEYKSGTTVTLPSYPTSLPASDVPSWAKQKTKPTYSASEIGLGNVGNFKAVSTVASQGLTDTEKSNARVNIGAQVAGSYASSTHNHDDKYQAKGSYASVSHTHAIANITNLQSALDGKAASNHTHSQYLTSHQDISGKLDNSATGADSLLSKITTSFTAIPTDDTYFIRQDIAGGNTFGRVKFSTLWSYIKGKTDSIYAKVSHKHTKSEITDFPTSMPANGGNSSTVNGHTVKLDVPENAKFTDTNTWRGIQDNLTSSSTSDSLSANQGKVLKGLVDGKASSNHNHDSAYRKKLVGTMDGDGKTNYCQLCTLKISQNYVNTPIEITVQERCRPRLDRLSVLFESVNNTDPGLNRFTVIGECRDWYISKTAASTWVIYGLKGESWAGIRVVDYTGNPGINITWNLTGVSSLPSSKTQASWGGNVNHANSADNATNATKVNNHTVNADVPSGAKFTDTNTWRPLGTTADTACAGNDSRLSNARPASDVSAWAKASSKPSYSWSEIGNKPSTFTPSSHTHNYAGSSSAGGSANSLSYFQNTSSTNVGQAEGGSNAIAYISDYSGTALTSGVKDGALYRQAYSTSWVHQIYGDYRTGQIAVRGKNNGAWQNWRRVLDESNYKTFCTPANIGAAAANHSHSNYLTGINKSMVVNALGYTPPTTDTNTWRGVQNNLTSTATDQSLSAYQGKVLKDLVDKKTTFTYSSTQPTSPASNAVWIG